MRDGHAHGDCRYLVSDLECEGGGGAGALAREEGGEEGVHASVSQWVDEEEGWGCFTGNAGVSYELRETRHGWMVVDAEDTFVGRALRTLGEYSWEEVEILESLVGPQSVVVEAGAHVGAITVPIARKVARVIAFEPQRLVFQMLCANLVLSGIRNTLALQQAVGAEDGTALVPACPPENTGGVILKGATEGEMVVMRSIDSLGLPRVDLIKADVEEMELEVLRGAKKTIERDRPVLYLESNSSPDDLLDELEPLGYTAFWHFPPLLMEDRGGSPKLVVSLNLLCLPHGRDQAAANGAEAACRGDVPLDVAERVRLRLAA